MTLLRFTFAALLVAFSFSPVAAEDKKPAPPVYPTVPDDAPPAKAPAPPKATNDKAANDKPSTPAQPAPPVGQSLDAIAAELTLKIGDKAPALTVGDWMMKSEPIKEFEKDKIYVLEFWASWCPYCLDAIPHLNEIQKKYKDKSVVVIGVNCLEDDASNADKAIAKLETKPNYRLVKDNSDGKMAEKWLAAIRKDSLPTTMIVDQAGMLAWVGLPGEMDEPLQNMVDKKWDLKKARHDFLAAIERERAMGAVQQALGMAVQRKNFDKIAAAIEQMHKVDPNVCPEPLLMTFDIFLGMQEFDRAYALAEKTLVDKKDNAKLLGDMAWFILDEENQIAKRDFNVALKLAERANTVTKGSDHVILDTLAHAYFFTGNVDKAIETGKKAIEKIKPDDPHKKELVEEFTENLKRFEEEKKEK